MKWNSSFSFVSFMLFCWLSCAFFGIYFCMAVCLLLLLLFGGVFASYNDCENQVQRIWLCVCICICVWVDAFYLLFLFILFIFSLSRGKLNRFGIPNQSQRKHKITSHKWNNDAQKTFAHTHTQPYIGHKKECHRTYKVNHTKSLCEYGQKCTRAHEYALALA